MFALELWMCSWTKVAAEGRVEHGVECLRCVELDCTQCFEALDRANRVHAVQYLMSDHVGSVVSGPVILTKRVKLTRGVYRSRSPLSLA